MKKTAAILLSLAIAVGACGATDASWLSKMNKKLESFNEALGGSTSSTSTNSEPTSNSSRWVKCEENQYYTTYIDNKSAKAEGTAQNRRVSGYFKREFTPLGSQWLGQNSNGRVKPDTITYVIYKAEYGVNSCGTYGTWHYYDVNGNLIYNGENWSALPDRGYQQFGNYIPDSMQEQLKDRLFHAFGWDY